MRILIFLYPGSAQHNNLSLRKRLKDCLQIFDYTSITKVGKEVWLLSHIKMVPSTREDKKPLPSFQIGMSENRSRDKGKDPSFAVFANFGENVATLVIKLIQQGNDMKYTLFPSFSAIKCR